MFHNTISAQKYNMLGVYNYILKNYNTVYDFCLLYMKVCTVLTFFYFDSKFLSGVEIINVYIHEKIC